MERLLSAERFRISVPEPGEGVYAKVRAAGQPPSASAASLPRDVEGFMKGRHSVWPMAGALAVF